ncbi:hypothetical protein BKA70DRAFT_1418515 [Coprinopsis sp. MPI-PUGE-AT-0042]|nr:hypothetical protein BKA70DRAFT_1418515 [Coprinopsis sp. MPI-PUGE-AT-0042]
MHHIRGLSNLRTRQQILSKRFAAISFRLPSPFTPKHNNGQPNHFIQILFSYDCPRAFALGFWRECGEKWKGEGTYVHLDGTASALWLSSFTTTTEPPTVRKGSVLRRLAQSQRKELIQIDYLDVKTRAHGKQEIPVIGLLDSCSSLVSVRSCRGFYSRGPDRFLVFMASSSLSRTGGLPILYSSLTPASSTFQHLHLTLQLAGTSFGSLILRECPALGRLKQLRPLVLTRPSAISFCRNRVDAESVPRLDRDFIPPLERLGVDDGITRLV